GTRMLRVMSMSAYGRFGFSSHALQSALEFADAADNDGKVQLHRSQRDVEDFGQRALRDPGVIFSRRLLGKPSRRVGARAYRAHKSLRVQNHVALGVRQTGRL